MPDIDIQTPSAAVSVTNVAPVEPSKLDEIPTKFSKLLDEQIYGPNNWQNRRNIIKNVLIFCGIIVLLITLAVCYALMFTPTDVSPIITTLIWAISFLAGTIITGYVFVANRDQQDYRSQVTNILVGRK